MKVLTLNCGSSSLKYRLIELPSERELAAGEAQRVGPLTAEPSRILYRHGPTCSHETLTVAMPDHATAFAEVMKLLARSEGCVPDALGHRLVHGGQEFSRHVIATPEVLERLDSIKPLAPLHNPPAIDLVFACQRHYPSLPQVLVFDTAYHSHIPDYARTYALPRGLCQRLGIRKYGFHGTSHQYVATEAAKMLGKPVDRLNAVSCHLGSGGASLCAVVSGQSVDNTMGFSPLQGLIMSTRCGDLDSAAALRLLSQTMGDEDAVESLLNRHSGVLGLSGHSADIRDVLLCADHGDATLRVELTRQVYLWRIRKYLGSYLTVTAPADAIIFTDTIGETMPEVRWNVCADLGCFGLEIDPRRNQFITHYPADVATAGSCIRILVIQTNEELAIARATYNLLAERKEVAA